MSDYVDDSPLNVIGVDDAGTMTATISKIGDADYIAKPGERLPAPIALAKHTGGWYAENEDGMSLEEALKSANMDFRVEKRPSMSPGDEPGEVIDFPAYRGTVGIWPDGTKRGLGQVSESYQIIQPAQVAELAATLMAQSEARIVAAVCYGDPIGTRTCLAFKLPEQLIIGGDDATDRYLYLGNSYNKKSGLWGQFAPIRLACTNMQTVTFGDLENRFSFPHTGDVNKKVDDALVALDVATAWSELWRKEAERLLTIKMSDKELDAWLRKVLPTPKGLKTQRGEEGWDARRLEMKQIITTSDTCAHGRGTAKAALDGVWEWADFYAPTQTRGLPGQISRWSRIVAGGELEKVKLRAARLLATR